MKITWLRVASLGGLSLLPFVLVHLDGHFAWAAEFIGILGYMGGSLPADLAGWYDTALMIKRYGFSALIGGISLCLWWKVSFDAALVFAAVMGATPLAAMFLDPRYLHWINVEFMGKWYLMQMMAMYTLFFSPFLLSFIITCRPSTRSLSLIVLGAIVGCYPFSIANYAIAGILIALGVTFLVLKGYEHWTSIYQRPKAAYAGLVLLSIICGQFYFTRTFAARSFRLTVSEELAAKSQEVYLENSPRGERLRGHFASFEQIRKRIY